MPYLPKKQHIPSLSLSDYSTLLYGPRMIGKSTWCVDIPGVIFLDFQGGLKSIQTYKIPEKGIIKDWPMVRDIFKELATTNHPYKAIVIDGLEDMYNLCALHICERYGEEYPGDIGGKGGRGKGWGMIKVEFRRLITCIRGMPFGMFLICNEKEFEVETPTEKYMVVRPGLSQGMQDLLRELTDITLYFNWVKKKGEDGKPILVRAVRTQSTRTILAGDKTGRLPKLLPMSYSAFENAFREGGDEGAKG